MVYKLLTNLVVLIHLAFIIYVVLGGLLVLRWRRSVYVHIPAVIWGAVVEYLSIICPLTPLENYFRNRAGYSTYGTGFIEQYITPLIYPENLERNTQFIFGSLVIIINIVVYLLIIIKFKKAIEK